MSHTTQGMWLWYCASPPISSLFNPVASWVLSSLSSPTGQKSCHQWTWRGCFYFCPLHAHTIPACVSPLLSHMFKTCPHLPLRVLNLNLILLFMAFACLKAKTPLCSTLTMSLKLQFLEMWSCPLWNISRCLCHRSEFQVLWRRFRCMLVFPGFPPADF